MVEERNNIACLEKKNEVEEPEPRGAPCSKYALEASSCEPIENATIQVRLRQK